MNKPPKNIKLNVLKRLIQKNSFKLGPKPHLERLNK